ncbi:Beta-amylase [Olea europaea subsp. europaea]|uniref:Beta-amylase n=1 Tax=Olea europaea subsp. europaea TaxID=158383 RepID=A0A8S0T7L4_OLEEU|nr:Beta-amylase [Olea europaea subsp. europaea]
MIELGIGSQQVNSSRVQQPITGRHFGFLGKVIGPQRENTSPGGKAQPLDPFWRSTCFKDPPFMDSSLQSPTVRWQLRWCYGSGSGSGIFVCVLSGTLLVFWVFP